MLFATSACSRNDRRNLAKTNEGKSKVRHEIYKRRRRFPKIWCNTALEATKFIEDKGVEQKQKSGCQTTVLNTTVAEEITGIYKYTELLLMS